MSQQQKDFFIAVMRMHEGAFHHGDCIGADAEAHDMIMGELPYVVHIHPPLDPKMRAWKQGHELHPQKHYYERNKDIVGQSHYCLFFPIRRQPETGGTWYTINYAKSINRQFTVCLPNGTLGHSVTHTKEEAAIHEAVKRWNG